MVLKQTNKQTNGPHNCVRELDNDTLSMMMQVGCDGESRGLQEGPQGRNDPRLGLADGRCDRGRSQWPRLVPTRGRDDLRSCLDRYHVVLLFQGRWSRARRALVQ